MANQSGSRLYGDDYQHLYSWHKILDLLNPDTEIDHIWVEHPSAGAADDLTIHPKNPVQSVTHFYQIKGHRDLSKTYSMEGLITPTKKGTKSLLKSLWDSWEKLRRETEGDIAIWLASDWNADNFLGSLIHEHRLKEEFFEKISNYRTGIGQECRKWKEHLNADDQDLEDFCRSLCFDLGVRSSILEGLVDAEMRSYKLKSGVEHQHVALGLIRDWIKEGRGRKVTPSRLKLAVYGRKLCISLDEITIYDVPVNFWGTYLANLGEFYEQWHIPSELQPLITWEINPVPVDSYIKLKPFFELSFLPEVKKKTRTRVHSQTLSQVIANTTVLIVGNAGAGKSTCLKYLCHQFAVKAQKELEQEADFANIKIPILITLRKYGPTRLEALIKAQLGYHGLSIEQATLSNVLRNAQFVFLLDGIDEVKPKQRDDLINELAVLRESYSRHTIVVTAREQPELPLVENFEVYEIQHLDKQAISAFAQCYLGNDSYGFIRQAEERRLENVIQVPLLLTLCLIVFKREKIAFDGLADIYKKIIELYKDRWENPKRRKRIEEPIHWDILEDSMSILAHRMIADGIGYSISSQDALDILKDAVRDFKNSSRWSYKHTVYDLRDQLLAHNFLESFGDKINFWHASFRDFFAALFVTKLPFEQIVEYVKSKDWSLVTAFLGGLFPNSKLIRDVLVNESLKSTTFDAAYWPIEVLGLVGSDTTGDIIRAIAQPSYAEVHLLVARILSGRRFKGKDIFNDVFEIRLTIDGFDTDYYLADLVPDPNLINFSVFNPTYKRVMLALSKGDIDNAKWHQQKIWDQIDDVIYSQMGTDQWLLSRGVQDVDDFHHRLRSGQFEMNELRTFCRNTLFVSSLPYLEVISQTVKDPKMRLEANLAIQCVKRHTW